MKGPHKVDSRLGFVDSIQFPIAGVNAPQSHPLAIRGNFDRMRVGRVEDGKRYLGNGAWQRINVEESRLNERNLR